MTEQDRLPFVQLYILSHNRPQLLLQTLDSCLKIDYPNFEIIVSDNSTHDEVRMALNNHPLKNRFKLFSRQPMRHFSEHLNLILQEVSAEYFMAFHDDDLVDQHILKHYVELMQEHPNLSACAGNSYLIENGSQTTKTFFNSDHDAVVTKPDAFLKSYFFDSHSHPPFPFHMYRTALVKNLRLSYLQGRMHCDTSFLYEVMKRGGLYWSKKTCGYYRRHNSNMSVYINFRALNSLYHYFKRVEPQLSHVVYDYKQRSYLSFYLKNSRFIFKSKSNRRLFLRSFFYALTITDRYFVKAIKRISGRVMH